MANHDSRRWLRTIIVFVGAIRGVGILPLQRGISREGHLFGLPGGATAARFLAARRR